MITFKQTGNFKNTEMFFSSTKSINTRCLQVIRKYADEGVAALASATPIDSGETASSWGYDIVTNPKGLKIKWVNSNVIDGVPIAILIQYGHATGNGGYVQGRDYINPAMRPIFDKLANDIWKEVTKQ